MSRTKLIWPLRLTIPLALVAFTLLLSFWSIQYNGRISDEQVESREAEHLTKLMTRLQITIEHAFDHDDQILIQREISGLASELDYKYILLFDDKGRILASSKIAHIGHSFIQKLDSLSVEERKLVFGHLSEVRRTEAGKVYLDGQGDHLVGVYPITIGHNPQKVRDPVRGFLLIFQDLAPLKQEALKAVYRQVIQFSVVLGLLTVGLGIFFDQVVSRRINRIVGVTERVAQGDYSVRTGLGGRDEIGQLAASIDQMVASRQGAEEMLHKLNRAVEQSPVSVIITDLAANIEYINPRVSEVTGYQPAELLGQNPRLFKSGQHELAVYQRIWTELTAGRKWRGELMNKKKNGELFWESATIAPIFDESGRIINYLAVKEDITEKKLREQELGKARQDSEAANLAKTNFLATMSHELRTPMNGILGMGQILLDNDQSAESQEMIEVILSSARSLVSVLDEVLDISRIEARQMTSEREPLNLLVLLSQTEAMFGASARAKGLGWVVDSSQVATADVMGDASLITKVLSNLVGNALKFTHTGEVKLAVRNVAYRGGAGMRFEVSDTGVGIPATKLGQIFQSFTQADSSSTRRFGGVGLGLAITQNLVHLMGGEVGVQSQEGEGSLFWFEIPAPPLSSELGERPEVKSGVFNRSRESILPSEAGDKKPRREARTDLPTPAQTGSANGPLRSREEKKGATRRILVVEDDPINASVIRRILALNHFEVIEAENGRVAMDILERQPVDLVLMDCLMPVLDGYKATRLIRERERKGDWPGRLPVIAVTARAMAEDKALCLEAGMDDYLTKPLEMTDLLDKIHHLLGEKTSAPKL